MARAKPEQVALSKRMRADGASWAEVAAEFRARWGLNARQTIRISRGLSQEAVVNGPDGWNQRWPKGIKAARNISTWECWPQSGHEPSLVVLDRLAHIYRCSVADLVSDLGDYGFDINGTPADDPGVDRRTMLASIGGSFAAIALPSLRSRRVAPELAGYFDDELRRHYTADMLLGPHLLINTVTAQYQAICLAADATSGDLHSDLLRAGAGYAALAGWLCQDAGDLARSTAWRAETLEMAHRAGDLQLISYALTNKAMLRVEVGDGVGAVDLATAALADEERLAPKVKIVALVQAAHGYSLIGQREQADRTLDTVAGLTDQIDDAWPWGNAVRRTPSYLEAQRATCYGRLGLAAESAEMWRGVIGAQPVDYRRDSGVYLARHAAALLGAGEPVEAARKAAQAVACLHDTGSARMGLELSRLRDRAINWSHTSPGRELVDVLSDIA